ncbi:MAG: hypothetical protein B6I20_13410 [Bacteroidetes bacterium 4572_117]|nr:MAG: hypothetical protein B6I20_13410 [Bacteroidetes bacterium 4572_117]
MEILYKRHAEYLRKVKITFSRNFVNEIDWTDRLIGIKGSRGVGKTTFILHYIKENFANNKKYLYVSLDDLAFTEKTIVGLVEDFVKLGGKVLFLDEIHKYTNWSQELKNCYDRFQELKIVFTGSSILHILKGNADLSRRAVVYEMEGLSFREFINIVTKQKYDFKSYSLDEIIKDHYEIALEITEKIKPFEFFADYLRYGFYPFFLESKTSYFKKLLSTIYLVLESDIAYLNNVELRHVQKLKRLLYVLSTMVPLQPNVNKLSRDLETSRLTIMNYMNYLEDGRLIKLLHADRYRTMKRPDKIFLDNTNLMYAIAPENVNKGNLRETFFYNQLNSRHFVNSSKSGDFLIDEKYTFEVGGKNKSREQIKNVKNAFIAADPVIK